MVVHCAAGDSRSATIVMAYMLAHCKYELRKAFSVVRQNRPCVWPNNGFMSAIVAFEAQNRRPKDKKKPPSIAIAEYEHWGEYAGPERGSDDYGDPFFEGLAPGARRALAEQSTRYVIDRRAGRPGQSRTSSVEGRRPSMSRSRSWGVVLRVNSMRRANSMRLGVSGRLTHAGHPAHPVVPDGGSHRGGAGLPAVRMPEVGAWDTPPPNHLLDPDALAAARGAQRNGLEQLSTGWLGFQYTGGCVHCQGEQAQIEVGYRACWPLLAVR